MVPVTPDFAERMLAECPQGQRVGKVFPLIDLATGKLLAAYNTVGPVVSAIGRRAGVVVGHTEKLVKQEGRKVKKTIKLFAGAHDLRRAFCSRWARKVTPAILQRLARHAHISTTMSFYVCLTADKMAGDLWANHGTLADKPKEGNISGNIGPKKASDKGAGNRA